MERTALARLAADEQFLEWRRENAQNFGSAWLKPPGVAKTLYQMREEKREQEEHQEALRREQLAQELAEAEAGGMPDDMMDDVQLDGAQDLDDEIPDADDAFDMDDDDDNDDDDENEDGDGAADDTEVDEAALREERQNDLVAARMRMTDDAFREALVRGDPDGDDMYGGEEELEHESQGQMLDEDDFAHGPDEDDATGLDMEADLDDDIPEAGSGDGYEHTDSEAEVSSSRSHEDDEDDDDGDAAEQQRQGPGACDSSDDEGYDDADDLAGHEVGFVPRTAPLGPPQSPTTMVGRTSASGPSGSMDLNSLLSHDGDGSGFAESSPTQSRRARHG